MLNSSSIYHLWQFHPCPHSTKGQKVPNCSPYWHHPRLNCRVTMITFTFSIAFRNRRYMSSSVFRSHANKIRKWSQKQNCRLEISLEYAVKEKRFKHAWYFWSSWTCSGSPCNLSAGVSQHPYASPRYSGPLCSPENQTVNMQLSFWGTCKDLWPL